MALTLIRMLFLLVVVLHFIHVQFSFVVQAFTIPCSALRTRVVSLKQEQQLSLVRKTTISIVPSSTHAHEHYSDRVLLKSSENDTNNENNNNNNNDKNGNGPFDLTTTLFCSGLAFDAYAEPPPNSSRWERGSSGCNVAFQSPSFTRNIYKGLLQIQPIKCTDLPDEDDSTEKLITGSGKDAYVLVAVAEGKWKEDIELIEKSKFNNGVLDLQGCAHVGRSSTAWSNVNEKKAQQMMKNVKKVEEGYMGAYHIPSSWGKGGQAIWENDTPFYLYVQDPKDARVVFTVMDDDIVGKGDPIGSTSRKLFDILPAANVDDPLSFMKSQILQKMKNGEQIDLNDNEALIKNIAQEWEGDLKLTSKPRKKDKNGQIATMAAAGAMMAGPAGAAVGGIIGSLYEGEARGRLFVKIKYMPIPKVSMNREKYKVKGGLPGVDWGELYEKHIQQQQTINNQNVLSSSSVDEKEEEDNNYNDDGEPITQKQQRDSHIGGKDLEFCCFINHDKTGCACAIYRSLEKKMIAISFRGTCELVDLLTDASITQEAWVEGEDIEKDDAVKVHVGFRKSLNSISRKLKELLLASIAPGNSISEYDLIVTGHSLGGSLSTLFTADIGEYGIDAGRGLPQLEPSEPWYSSLASNFFNNKDMKDVVDSKSPPRPKSLKMYNFGSPRVGNKEFTEKFDSLVGNGIDEAYRIVNGKDVVARLPRTVNALNLVSIGYEHCAPTVLISLPEAVGDGDDGNSDVVETETKPLLWIEGQSEGSCPVRDGSMLIDPLAQGSLIGDIVSAVQNKETSTSSTAVSTKEDNYLAKGDVLSKISNAVKDRMETFTASDLISVVGLDRNFVERESKIIQSVFSGEALSHHMEDEYYSAMGRACGFKALVGDEIQLMDESEL